MVEKLQPFLRSRTRQGWTLPPLIFIIILKSEIFSVMSDFVIPWTIQSMEFFRPEYWSGSLSLLQGIFPTQGLNPGLPHCRQILYQLSHKGSLRILDWVAYPFSRGSSWLRNQTGVSYIAGGFFTNWAMREAHLSSSFNFRSGPPE